MDDIRYLLIENVEGELHDNYPDQEDLEFKRWVERKTITIEDIEDMFERSMDKNRSPR